MIKVILLYMYVLINFPLSSYVIRKNDLPVTLWDNFALDFADGYIFEKEKKENKAVVLILAGMTVRSFKGLHLYC